MLPKTILLCPDQLVPSMHSGAFAGSQDTVIASPLACVRQRILFDEWVGGSWPKTDPGATSVRSATSPE